jgi:NADH-quinone oxidoreductase subunit F
MNRTHESAVASPATGHRLSAATRDAIAAEVAKYPHHRTALLPSLKLAQREIGWLPDEILAEVADLVGVPHAAASELTTFYSMLHTHPHGRLAVEVCVQLPCGFCGGERLLAQLEQKLGIRAGETTDDGGVSLHRTPECMGGCHRAPMVRIGDHYVENLRTEADVDALCRELRQGRVPTTAGTRNHDFHPASASTAPTAKKPVDYTPVLLAHPGRTTQVSLDEYRAAGGYEGLAAALQKKPEEVTDLVKQSNLRGRGGAAFSAGVKWSFVPKGPGPKHLVVNADESEPGTFKDRELMEVESHLLIEGMAIASYAIGCNEAFLYLRGEYVEAGERMRAAIAAAERAGILGDQVLGSAFALKIHVFLGAGAYICGEETALLESLEGKRPMPRSRPPFPAVSGLYARPTVVNNVETICNVPLILRRGVAWYKGLGPNEKSAGPKIYCLSGWVNRPGNYELPLGAVTFRELIEHWGGGMRDGAKVKGVLPAGISAPMIPADKLDAKLDYEGVAAAGSMLGSASLIVIPEDVSLVRAATRMLEFFRHESCGKCTPCREGTMWLHKVLIRISEGGGTPKDVELLLHISKQIGGKTLCALGEFATSPVTATIKHFQDEYRRAISGEDRGRPDGAGADWSRRG